MQVNQAMFLYWPERHFKVVRDAARPWRRCHSRDMQVETLKSSYGRSCTIHWRERAAALQAFLLVQVYIESIELMDLPSL